MIEPKPKTLSTEKSRLEYNIIWEYFQFHAKQRLDTFRFYITMASAIFSGFIILFAKSQDCIEKSSLKILILIMLILGLILIVFSIVYWILDNRNNLMINISRDHLINMEKSDWFQEKLFSKIEEHTRISNSIRYHHCFSVIFLTFIIIGLIISFYSLFNFICC